MKIKVSEATNLQLDWMVAKCEGIELYPMYMWGGRCLPTGGSESTFYYPSEDWSQGGPIIERECINLFRLDPKTEEDSNFWVAHIDGLYCRYGLTALIAAMRCYVASKLGDEVEVPEELL